MPLSEKDREYILRMYNRYVRMNRDYTQGVLSDSAVATLVLAAVIEEKANDLIELLEAMDIIESDQ